MIGQTEFRTFRNKFNRLKKKMKQDYYHDLKSWQVMRSIINRSNDKTSISYTFILKDKELTDIR